MYEIENQVFILRTAQIHISSRAVQENIWPLCLVIFLVVIYLPEETDLLNTCIRYEQPQYFGEELNQFRFAYHTDFKNFPANEQQMLTTTTRPGILLILAATAVQSIAAFKISLVLIPFIIKFRIRLKILERL